MNKLFSWLERRTLTVKLTAGLVFVLGLCILMGGVNLLSQRSLHSEMVVLYQKELLGVAAAKELQVHYLTIGRELRQASLTGPGPRREAALKTVADAAANLQSAAIDVRGRLFRDDTKTALREFEESFAAYKANVDSAAAMLLKGAEGAAASFIASDTFRNPGFAANASLARLVALKEDGAKAASEEAIEASLLAIRLTWMVMLAALGGGALVGWLMHRSVQVPTARLQEAVEKLAHGHLDIQVPYQDYPNEVGSLARSVSVLQAGSLQIENESWLKKNLVHLA